MAVGLQAQAAAALDSNFQQKVLDAIVTAAVQVYNEATTLGASIKAGTANVSIPVAPALASAIAANTVIRVGSELLLCTAGAAQGASAIPTNTTTATDHFQGEAVSPPSVVNHLLRAIYAKNVLNAPDAYRQAWSEALASQGLDAASADSAINSGVGSLWNAMAGA